MLNRINTLCFKLTQYAIALLLTLAALSGCEQKTAPAQASAPVEETLSSEQMILIPAGEFIMGSDEVDSSGKAEEFGFNEPWYLPEHPKRTVNLPAYYIDKTEVTNAQFKRWLLQLGTYTDQELQIIAQRLSMNRDDDPVRSVTWTKAQQYCYAQGKRLPTEAEWEKAARGTDAREYPWGNEWQQDYLNAGQNEDNLSPVGSYPKGASPYGVLDMAGNVMEWTADWYEAYPGGKYVSPNYGRKRKVVRGGGWGGIGHYVIPHYFRTAYRFNFEPDRAYNDVGFRCVKDAPKS